LAEPSNITSPRAPRFRSAGGVTVRGIRCAYQSWAIAAAKYGESRSSAVSHEHTPPPELALSAPWPANFQAGRLSVGDIRSHVNRWHPFRLHTTGPGGHVAIAVSTPALTSERPAGPAAGLKLVVRQLSPDSGNPDLCPSRSPASQTASQSVQHPGIICVHPRTSLMPAAALSCVREITDTEEVTGSNPVSPTQ
jgi:hypothetical protein